MTNNPNPKSSNPFINGCSNIKWPWGIRLSSKCTTTVWTKVRICLVPRCYTQMLVEQCLHLGKLIGTVYSPLLKILHFFLGQTEIISVLWNMFSNRTECPMEFKKSFADTVLGMPVIWGEFEYLASTNNKMCSRILFVGANEILSVKSFGVTLFDVAAAGSHRCHQLWTGVQLHRMLSVHKLIFSHFY